MRSESSDGLPRSVLVYATISVVVAAALTLHFVVGISAPLLRGKVVEGQMLGRDFVNYWPASVLAWRGEFATIFDIEAYNVALRRIMGRDLGIQAFMYPPHGLWVVLPLALLPYRLALVTWQLVTFALLAVAAFWGRRKFGSETFVLAVAPASLINVAHGQNGFLTAALLVGGLRMLERRPVAAGLLFGLLSFKPQLGLLLPFALAAGRHWRAFATAAFTVILLFVTSIAVLGGESWRVYLQAGLPVAQAFLRQGTGMFQLMMPSTFMAGRILELPSGVAIAAQAIVALLALAGCVWSFRRRAPLELRAAVLVVGTFLASPYSFNYDMTAVAAVSILAAPWLRDTMGGRQALVATWFLPLLVMHVNSVGVPLGPVALASLFGVLVHRIRRVHDTARPHAAGDTDRAAVASGS